MTKSIKPVRKIVSEYRKQRGESLRDFAKALTDGLKEGDQVSYQTIKNWEDGIHQPKFDFLLTLVMTLRDWRSDFAFDVLSAMKPEIYPPATSIGENAVSSEVSA
jgi:transcriptional regulator with XRE-family HTH domain